MRLEHSMPLNPSRALTLLALLAAVGASAACGSSGAPKILDTEKVERAIERSSLAQRDTHAQVSCPAGVRQKRGLTFACIAVVHHTSARFVVRQLDDAGHVRYLGTGSVGPSPSPD